MQKLSNLIFIALFAKLLSLGIWWYLPDEGIELHTQNSLHINYQRDDFKKMIDATTFTKKKAEVKVTMGINKLILIGLYGRRTNGYAIVAKKSTPSQTSIIGIGESYEGYVLKSIYVDHIIFEKNAKEYILSLKGNKTIPNAINVISPSKTENQNSLQKIVRREDINGYAENFSQIWKDIAITEVKKSGKINGFKIQRVRKGSKMADLGLRKNDIIIRANNIDLTSYKDALNLYNQISDLDTIELTVLRNNQEKEIIYEIH